MAGDDGELRQLLRRHLSSWHWSILDGATSSGCPDLAWGHGGRSGLTELKQTHAWAVSFRPSQLAWHAAHAAAGGHAPVLVRRWRTTSGSDELWGYEGRQVLDLSAGGLRQVPPTLRESGGPRRWDWSAVAQLLWSGLSARQAGPGSPST